MILYFYFSVKNIYHVNVNNVNVRRIDFLIGLLKVDRPILYLKTQIGLSEDVSTFFYRLL